MPWPRCLLLSALLTGSALGQVMPPPGPPARSQPAPRLNIDELNAEIARQAPAYGGFFVRDGLLSVYVTSTDPAQRQAAVRELFAVQGEELRRRGFSPETVVFVPGQFNAEQLLEAKVAARGIDGWQSIDIDETRNRVVVQLRLPGMEERARAFLAEQGLPPGIVVIAPVPAGKLPEGPPFRALHQARLEVPTRVSQGDTLPIELKVINPSEEPLVLDHGACALEVEIRDAATGEVVLPVPGAQNCISVLYHTLVPARSTVTVGRREWNLQLPTGERVPPGRYLIRATFEVGVPDAEVIRPPDQTFEVVAGNPATGTAQVRAVLRDGASGIEFRARLGEERGRQVVFVFVPDRRAQMGVERLLRERRLPLDRVRFRILPPTRVPGQGQGQAQLKVEGAPGGGQHGFELSADVTPWRVQGAWRCEPVINVVDPRSGDVVGGSPGFWGRQGWSLCSEDGQPLPFPWRGGWNGRRSDGDGTPLPAGRYEVHAGLKVTLKTGRVVWLLAPVQELTVP